MREERKQKREDPCGNNEQLKCNCTATGFALSRVEQQREKREERRERREKREERREKRKERSAETEEHNEQLQLQLQQGLHFHKSAHELNIMNN